MTPRQVLYLVRPHTLPASLAPVVTALALAALDGFFCPTTAILTVLVGVLAQIVSNIANDLFDFKKKGQMERIEKALSVLFLWERSAIEKSSAYLLSASLQPVLQALP